MATIPLATDESGERRLTPAEAFAHAVAAVAELGVEADLAPVLDGSPGTWRCVLRRDGEDIRTGLGLGKGSRDEARTGALFESLEHFLSGLHGLRSEEIRPVPAHRLAAGPLAADLPVSLLGEAPDGPVGCLPYRSLTGGPDLSVPVFLSMPDYLGEAGRALRRRSGDTYDYRTVCRYSVNNGWAAGTEPVEATVHAINELIERDALSLLLAGQFLRPWPERLALVDPGSLPVPLAGLLAFATTATGGPVHLIDMTTDLDVPAYMAYLPAPVGRPARVCGWGASLSRRYAITRALTELVQLHCTIPLREQFAHLLPARRDDTGPCAQLHACYLSDFTAGLPGAEVRRFEDTEAPATPAGHLERLVSVLRESGLGVLRREHYVTEHLAVVNVLVPGLERFMLVTDGHLVVPGDRGMAVIRGGTHHDARDGRTTGSGRPRPSSRNTVRQHRS
ncbi:YcaO-like family protein [Streptomyces yaizuensis]|uniref:YcaO-like family protein n=1 Tax=Streptomyces yaizuensis TaxID=2989713 RepID=A0ABQ5NRL2_9ACTN|nr:YcaO-like family protein [Streptomyces sp. YSPA8]GLF92996.1 YcaO-like family protein [Streptomyces sp. YSPA8]